VNWHYFKENLIEIGNRCLLAGDNGSGKSTVIDAIQYVMAADLRKAKFNSAADERRGGGRDLMGYVRCKSGSESSEYRRGDTVAHIMLEWSASKPGENFSCGVCVEAWKDNHYSEHFWTGQNKSIAGIAVHSETGKPFDFRQFKNVLGSENVVTYDSKHLYIRELTNKLGVWKRLSETNPYLDALTRSIGFRPLDSIDKFVCDFILEDNPVSIQDMKQNLENYKEADREAQAAEIKIRALKKICAKAADWENYNGLITKQEYLKLKIEELIEKQKKEEAAANSVATENALKFIEQKISVLVQKQFEAEQDLRAVDRSLAENNEHHYYQEVKSRIEETTRKVSDAERNAETYHTLKAQCEAMLDRPLKEDFDGEENVLQADLVKYQGEKYNAKAQKEKTNAELRDVQSELADLERGILRYPDAPVQLRSALVKAGIEAFFLAEAADIDDSDWTDAVEGWLNTRRFALLVNPDEFQKALEVYNKLPRSVAGAFIPNIARMRGSKVKKGSLAEIIKAEGYARIYIDYTLGNVMRADISSLKTYESAVTKECMTYSNHTASRIKEEVYRRHYLGRAALEKRKIFLLGELQRLEEEFAFYEKTERDAGNNIERCNRVIKHLFNLRQLFSSIGLCQTLKADLAKLEAELAAIDTSTFRGLEARRTELEKELSLLKKDNNDAQFEKGKLQTRLLTYKQQLDDYTQGVEEKRDALKLFAEEHPLMIGECETYAEEKLRTSTIENLIATHVSTLKGFRSRTENLKREYAALVRDYEAKFHCLLGLEPGENGEAESLLKRLETSELPAYREKIARAYQDAEKEFKDHFISRLNEHIEEAKLSFDEINEVLRTLHFGHDQYSFSLEELSERRGEIQMIREASQIPATDESLFAQFTDPRIKEAAEKLYRKILNSPLDSKELRDICDYRKYYHYDIMIKETDSIDPVTGAATKLSLSKVLKEKSGGESQTPYYVAIAASFYRFFKARPEETVRLVVFDEAFNRMDDERIAKILSFYKSLNLQIITSVPPEKIEAIGPFMDRINVISRSGSAVRVRDCTRIFAGGGENAPDETEPPDETKPPDEVESPDDREPSVELAPQAEPPDETEPPDAAEPDIEV